MLTSCAAPGTSEVPTPNAAAALSGLLAGLDIKDSDTRADIETTLLRYDVDALRMAVASQPPTPLNRIVIKTRRMSSGMPSAVSA